MSVDGHIDDTSGTRLVLSGGGELGPGDEGRSSCDAICVGAATVRRDDPRLVLRSAERRARRAAAGQPEDPIKVPVTVSGNLPAKARFFTVGSTARIVYCA